MKLSTGKVAFPIEFDNGDKAVIYFNPNDRGIQERIKGFEASIEKRIKEINEEIGQIIKALGADIHDIPGFMDYKPVKNVDYKDYTIYMSHLAHEIKRLGEDEFVFEYQGVKESGIRGRYLRGLLNYLTKNDSSKPYGKSNIVLDPLTYQMYFTYGKKDILEYRLKEAIPEFLMQGLLITDVQEAVGGTRS